MSLSELHDRINTSYGPAKSAAGDGNPLLGEKIDFGIENGRKGFRESLSDRSDNGHVISVSLAKDGALGSGVAMSGKSGRGQSSDRSGVTTASLASTKKIAS